VDHSVTAAVKSSFTILGNPQGKPRITHQNKFSDSVKKYWQWADKVREAATGDKETKISDPRIFGIIICAHCEMPESWAQKKRDALAGTLHQQKPDTDNIGKGIKDSLFADDKEICVDFYFKFWCHADEEPRVDVFILRMPSPL